MANPHPPQSNQPHLHQVEEVESANQQQLLPAQAAATEDEEDESEYDDDDYESTDFDDEEEEYQEGQEETLQDVVVIPVVESPPRVSEFVERCDGGDGAKRRRVERRGESCSITGIESGECSQDSQWNPSDHEGLFCTICMDVWTNTGDHRISCLPCGHIYGFACIKRWLQQGRKSGKCPQCNKKCTLKDVRKLFASRIVAVDEESQKRIRSLEAKCAFLEKKAADLCKKEAEWKKNKADLDIKVQQLERRTVFLEHLLGDRQGRRSGFVADVEGFQGQSMSGSNFSSNFRREGSSSIFVLQEELPVAGGRLFDVDAYSQILLMARRLPGIAGTHLLTKISLINPHESEDILLPSSTKAIKDLHFSPFNHNLALFATLGKKLSVLSMESKNLVLNFELPAAAWSCSWDSSSAHYLYAGLQNGSLLVFDMRQTMRPVESLKGRTCNPIHTIHSVLNGSTIQSGVRTVLSASSVGVCHWDFNGAERSYLVPETENQGVCISLAYCPSSNDIVASFRPRIEMVSEITVSQPVLTPSPLIGQGIPGSRVLLKKEGSNSYQKLSSSTAMVNDIRLPKSTIIDIENQKRLFASAEEVSNELVLHELPSFSAVQYLESKNQPVRDVKYINVNHQGLLGCLSEDALQLFTTSFS